MRHFPDRNDPDLDVGEIFSHAAFAASQLADAAFVVVDPEACHVIWANVSSAQFFNAATPSVLTRTLFGAAGHGGGWLDGLAQGVVPGRPPRLARGGLSRGFRMQAHTALIRSFVTPHGNRLLAFAVLEAGGPEVDGVSWKQPAWPPRSRQTDLVDETPVGHPAESADADDSAQDTSEAGLALARRSQVAVLRDRLVHALDGATALRLLWRTDIADRITQIDADGMSKLGVRLPLTDGRSFPEVVANVDQQGSEQFARRAGEPRHVVRRDA